tara:strand:- start:504 stop:668 length:165 start_codon:yes stop_codon:yes gene_type:complete
MKKYTFNKNFEKCFQNAIKKGLFKHSGNWMYICTGKEYDYFKNSFTRENRRVKK